MRALVTLAFLSFSLSFFAAEAAGLKVGDQAPCVVLNNIAANGMESEHCIRDPKVAGQAKVLEFFSATCSDCHENLPIVSALADRLDRKATLRLVGIDRSETLLRDYIHQHADLIHFDVALDTNRDAKRAYDIIETPTTFVLDAHNKVLFRQAGVLTPAELKTIETLVGVSR